jgi:cytochrome b6-f complex iron-sulfur subunit
MAEKISELSGAAREQRIAELKAKMKAAAQKAQAARAGEEAPAPAAAAPKPDAAPTAPKARPEAPAAAQAAAAVATAEAPAARPAREAAPASGNGAAEPKPRPAPRPAAKAETKAELEAPALSPQEMTRREFITYAWGAALGLLAVESGVVSFMFMYPRFRAGEFGGNFFIPESQWPTDPTAAPVPETTGKFWQVTTEEGEPKAIYMVCTHLGCLYKWEASNNRFECPCHGSKFTHDGYYIEGPAPRSLDSFEVIIEEGQVVVNTGRKITGDPAAESPARAAV